MGGGDADHGVEGVRREVSVIFLSLLVLGCWPEGIDDCSVETTHCDGKFFKKKSGV
jgi:hypothetical protein